jgi:two-component system, sensor histidine kinase and response regulator
MNLSSRSPSVMVVDDEPDNLRLLETMLREKGYEVRSFPRGRLALEAAALRPPDLILLDVNMPEISGYEVCERLKGDARLSEIPVLFLTALNETEDKVRAFRIGGVDFISKPFHFEEVYARVETQLKLHHLQRELKLQNERLEETVDLRTKELAEAKALLTVLDSAKDDFLNIISHELRTPLNGLLAVSELILGDDTTPAERAEFREMFDHSRQRVLSLLDDALLLTQIDVDEKSFKSAPVPLSSVLTRAIERTAEFACSRQVRINQPSLDLGFVRGEEDLLVRALQALFETAVKFSEEHKAVQIGDEVLSDSITLIIDSFGRTIPQESISRFFDVFAIGEAITTGGDLGLGPPLASRILSLFGGKLTVANRESSGIRLAGSFQLQNGA